MKAETTESQVDGTAAGQTSIYATDMGTALSKRNPNLPTPGKLKPETVEKGATMAREVENRSTTGSTNSSPTKGTPSKAPKSSFGQKTLI